MKNQEQVVVTGIGAVTPIGIGCKNFFTSLISGTSGVDRITRYDPSPYKCQIAAEVKDYDPSEYFNRKDLKRMGRYSQFALIAADEAISNSGLNFSDIDTTKTSVIVASAIGDFPMIEKQIRGFIKNGPGHMSAFTVPRVSSNMASSWISLKYSIMGPGFGISSACSTSCHAIAISYMLIKSGIADICITGGTEAGISPTFVESYVALRALSTRNNEPLCASRPFDKNRDGFVIGEGSGVLILESLSHARQRNAHILAEISGIGMSSDAYHITAPHPDGLGAVLAMKQSLNDAHISMFDIDYINAHGTSTIWNDIVETKAIKKVFGDSSKKIPVSSIKSMIGHCISASGCLEAISSIMSLNHNIIPPTINHDCPDPDCDLNYVPNKALKKKMNYIMSNSFAFGGQNCVLIFRKF